MLCYDVGGGIVADSDPELEYQETLHKAAGIRLAIERWQASTDRELSFAPLPWLTGRAKARGPSDPTNRGTRSTRL
jgi:hypothetical protein